MTSDTSLVIGLAILGILFLAVVILGSIIIFWIYGKLRQHEKDIRWLQDLEKGKTTYKKTVRMTDSAIEINDVDLQMTNDRRRPLSQASEISNRSCVRARMTIAIQKEEANIYGNAPPLGQVLMTAQHYYKVKTNTSTDVPVESVKVVNKETNKRSAVSRVLTEDWKEGVPTSLLFSGSTQSFDDVISQNKGIFVHKTIGPKGGNLKISGVSLVIPPNALEEDKFISVGILWDEKLVPTLSKKQALLSPIVLCHPSGLKFKSPVTLTFPHAAIKVTSDWIPKILKREGAMNEQSDWVPITLADYEERDVNHNHISLKLNHFTLYTCTGESKPGKTAAKLVHIVAFAGKLQRGSFFKPRLYCLNKYKDELEEVETLVTKMDPSVKMSDTTDLIVHDNEQDVVVEMAKLSDEWNLAGSRTEVLPFEQLWHAFHPHCTFVMKPKKPTVADIVCEIEAYQNGAENNSAKLKIAEKMSLSSSPLSSPDEDPQEQLINELVILLDPPNEAGTDAGDWRNLAEKMQCSLARIRWLGTQDSKTRILVEKWLDEGKTFTELEQIMRDINRKDAAEEIRKRFPDLELST
ncbi:UNC5C-like protein [Mercenaria mercenaria]|uniref:UNC5C-like protein n=1 Tax=Mercenaria mercenaria TaxID=6596 RepID=UPI00234EC4CC|nr:UNC5C-like protein [Mercenaria mercenaria]XP_053393954.1 UNC5C-like protein [Mercenaria mercenaria]